MASAAARVRAVVRHRMPVVGAAASERIFGELLWRRVDADPRLRPLVEELTDEQARLHFGSEEPLESAHLRLGVRLFHAWRVLTLRERLGERLATASVLDVGDTDGLMLKHLGKDGVGFNLSPAAIRNIEGNGIRAVLGDGHGLPFADGEFDAVLCFETLEHVESPLQVMAELARVTKPGGRVFVSVPWVPRTFVHSRDPSRPRGALHVFELCRDDFHAVVSHSPLEVGWEAVCELLGPPRTLEQKLFLAAHRGDHIVWGSFRCFQFFELAHRDGADER